MRALNNDIQRNLTAPLSELRAEFEAAGELFPQIRAMTRSGDTPQSERRRMLSRPPEILITTPESLNIPPQLARRSVDADRYSHCHPRRNNTPSSARNGALI